jgi:hypothetical protein
MTPPNAPKIEVLPHGSPKSIDHKAIKSGLAAEVIFSILPVIVIICVIDHFKRGGGSFRVTGVFSCNGCSIWAKFGKIHRRNFSTRTSAHWHCLADCCCSRRCLAYSHRPSSRLVARMRRETHGTKPQINCQSDSVISDINLDLSDPRTSRRGGC